MAIYAVGDEHDSFQIHSGAFQNGQTSAKAPNARFGMVTNSTNVLRLDMNTSVSECWIHGHTYVSNNTSASSPPLAFYNRTNSRSSVRWLTPSNPAVNVLQYTSNGSTWNTILTWTIPVNDTNHVFDIYFKGGAAGEAKVFSGGQLVASASGSWTLQDATWDAILFGSTALSTHHWGSIIVASEPTINWEIAPLTPTGAGNSSDWTGAYTDIDDSTTYSSADFLNSNTTGQKFLAALADVTVGSSRTVKAVAVSARGSIAGGAAISGVSFLARHAASDTTLSGLGLSAGGGERSAQHVMETDPSSAVWTESTVNALQLGVITT